jgi:hypothetical protein
MVSGQEYAAPLIILIVLVALLPSVFLITHTRPLTGGEMQDLASKRRNRRVRTYFTFSPEPVVANLEFKRRMAAGGTFYNIRESLTRFPSLAAALLKHKKHEWMLVAMERDRQIFQLWANKGSDKTRVCLSMPFDAMVSVASSNGYASLLVFHNHPNKDPSLYSCSQPSDADLRASAERATALNARGMNLIEFVCERGRAYEYRYSPAQSFMPIAAFLADLKSTNGVSKAGNIRLHLERIFY